MYIRKIYIERIKILDMSYRKFLHSTKIYTKIKNIKAYGFVFYTKKKNTTYVYLQKKYTHT